MFCVSSANLDGLCTENTFIVISSMESWNLIKRTMKFAKVLCLVEILKESASFLQFVLDKFS